MKTAHSRTGVFSRIGENLYRYTSSGAYCAGYRNKGKLIHRSLNTNDREFAKRLLKDEISKIKKVDSSLGKLTLEELLTQCDELLNRYKAKTAPIWWSISKMFKESWKHGLDLQLKSISAGQIEIWLGERRANFKNATPTNTHGSSAMFLKWP